MVSIHQRESLISSNNSCLIFLWWFFYWRSKILSTIRLLDIYILFFNLFFLLFYIFLFSYKLFNRREIYFIVMRTNGENTFLKKVLLSFASLMHEFIWEWKLYHTLESCIEECFFFFFFCKSFVLKLPLNSHFQRGESVKRGASNSPNFYSQMYSQYYSNELL